MWWWVLNDRARARVHARLRACVHGWVVCLRLVDFESRRQAALVATGRAPPCVVLQLVKFLATIRTAALARRLGPAKYANAAASRRSFLSVWGRLCRSSPGHRQPAPVTASRCRSPPANAREAPPCPPNPGFAIYLANFRRKMANSMRKITQKEEKRRAFPPHRTADTAGPQPASGYDRRITW